MCHFFLGKRHQYKDFIFSGITRYTLLQNYFATPSKKKFSQNSNKALEIPNKLFMGIINSLLDFWEKVTSAPILVLIQAFLSRSQINHIHRVKV